MIFRLDPRSAYPGVPAELTVQHDASLRSKPWVTNKGSDGRPMYRLKDGLTMDNTPRPFMEDVVAINPGDVFEAGQREPFVVGVKGATWGGSKDDIITHGTWKDGVWTVEFSRKLDTGFADDIKFVPGSAATFAVIVRDDSKGYAESVPVTLIP